MTFSMNCMLKNLYCKTLNHSEQAKHRKYLSQAILVCASKWKIIQYGLNRLLKHLEKKISNRKLRRCINKIILR